MPQLVGALPMPRETIEPGDPFMLPALHFHDVGDGMCRPQIGGIDLDRRPPSRLRGRIVTTFLEREAAAAEQRPIAGQLATPSRGDAFDRSQHVACPPGPEILVV